MPFSVRSYSVKARQGLFALFCALIVLLPASKSSPLYPMNDWVDVQCFFTVGREMLRGRMPYLDLYEQKGPLLYLMFAFASLISSVDFTGVFALEVACFSLFLYAALRCFPDAPLHPAAWLAAPAAGCLTVLCPAFCHGTSAEELSLFLYTGSIALVLKPSREGRPFSRRECACLGAALSAVILIKYTGALFFLPLLIYGLVFQLRRGGPRAGLKAVGWVLMGFVPVTLAVLLPYAVGGALPALIDIYFIKNLAGYASATPRYGTPFQQLIYNWILVLPALAGLIAALLRNQTRWAGAALAAAFGLLFAGTYLSGRTYPYYAMVFAAFTPLGFAFLLPRLKSIRKGAAVLTAAAVLLSGVLSWVLTENRYLRFADREEMPPYRFADIIREGGGKTLLNHGFLDGGFYLAAGISPTCPYFCDLALHEEEWTALRDRMIREGAFDYIVVRGRGGLPEFYREQARCAYPFEGREWTYILYRLEKE